LKEIVSSIKGKWKDRRQKATISKDLILPLVRVADELVGRTYHHARMDFIDQKGRAENPSQIAQTDHLYDLYLWSRFWAYTSRIRKGALSYKLTETIIGNDLLRYLDCLEAIRVSIISRAEQKLIGDGFADNFGWQGDCTFFGFVNAVHEDTAFSAALKPINTYYAFSFMREKRHALLAYTIVIQAMTDRFDPKKHLSSERTALFNKLNRETREDLHNRVLPVYLKIDAADASKYTGIHIRTRPRSLWSIIGHRG